MANDTLRRRILFWSIAFCALNVALSSCYNPRPNVNSDDNYERYLGVLEIPRNPTADNIKKLIDLWQDKDALVREGALKSMAALAYPAFKEYVLKSLEDQAWLVRAQAVNTLLAVDPEFAKKLLHERLAQEKDPRVKIQILKQIEATPEGLRVLVDALGDENPSVSYASYKRLVFLTGEKLPRDKALWQEWLRKNQNSTNKN